MGDGASSVFDGVSTGAFDLPPVVGVLWHTWVGANLAGQRDGAQQIRSRMCGGVRSCVRTNRKDDVRGNQRAGERAPRRVIAVVTDAFAPFHRDVLEGIGPHFNAAGFGTLGIAGRDVRTDRLLEEAGSRQGSYRGAFGTQLDVQGAVIVCGATHPSMSNDAIAAYIAELTDGPVVSLGIALPNVPSVEIDWETGITELMSHVLGLPRDHRIAFVRGFPGDPHSEMRETGFRTAMDAAGLAVDERLIVSGNFSVADGRNAIAGLLASGLRFDGLIAANDDMAVGAMAAIAAHGLAVPDDVIVAGFDDALCSVTSEPPLTTVLLDTARLTAATANLLLTAITEEVPLASDVIVRIDSRLIVRESTSSGHAKSCDIGSLTSRLADCWERERAPSGVDVDALAASAIDTLQTGDTAFLDSFELLCEQSGASSNRVEVIWLRHAWRELHVLLSELKDAAEISGLRVLLNHLSTIDRRLHPIETRRHTESISHRQLQERLVMRLASCSDTAALWCTLRSGLQSIGMLNAWVVAHESEAAGHDHPHRASMQLLFSLESDDLMGGVSFDSSGILPCDVVEVLEHDTHVLVPLRAGDSDIGYMVFEPRGEFLLELEAIASGVAQVLRHVSQVADLEGQAARLNLANEALDRLAGEDTLTGLANRKLFLERLDQHVAEAGPSDGLAVVFLDLDGFKQINDTLGHAAGDQLLRIIAGRLREVIGETDTLARLGGDEFTIIVNDETDVGRVFDVAQNALDVAAKPSLLTGQVVSVSASLGIASYPVDGATSDELIRNADIAMYAAKEAGKNRFEVYCEHRETDDTLPSFST